jgi:glycosyltransferase involved in cell wall biosynthesis
MDRIIFHEQESWARENTPEALAAAIEEFCCKDLKALGAMAARVAAERYSWARVFEGLLCIYREVCTHYRQHQVK